MQKTVFRTCRGCGKSFEIPASDTARGRGKYCSMDCSATSFVRSHTKYPPLKAGARFHMLELIEPIAKGRYPTWKALCDCGTEIVTRSSRFRGKRPLLSCGCYRVPREGDPNAITKHKLYALWAGMVARTKNKDDPIYGGRGIKVCDRWKSGDGDRNGFQCFVDDMGPRPSPTHSVDRYPDNDGNYEPSNCRWATNKEQSRNRRQNIFVEVGGNRLCLMDAVPLLNSVVDYNCVLSRLGKGWPLEHAISLPKIPGVPLRNRLRQLGAR
jgi:hypothetical protein